MLVATVVAIGRLGDVVGRKLIYTYGFAVFTLATVGCGLAPSLAVLIVCRVVQALGAAMLQANSVALIITSLPVARRAAGLGLQGAAQALGLALGPTVGGLLIDAGGWRWVFFATVPAGVFGTVAGWFLLPRTKEKAEPGRFDWAGLRGVRPDRRGRAARPVSPALGLRDRRPRSTFPGTGGAPRRAAAPAALVARPGRPCSAALLSYLALFGVLLAAPFYAEDVLHLSAVSTGLVVTALPAALGITGAAGRGRR